MRVVAFSGFMGDDLKRGEEIVQMALRPPLELCPLRFQNSKVSICKNDKKMEKMTKWSWLKSAKITKFYKITFAKIGKNR